MKCSDLEQAAELRYQEPCGTLISSRRSRATTPRIPTWKQRRPWRVSAQFLWRSFRPVLDGHQFSPPGLVHRGNACRFDAGGDGSLSLKFRHSGSGRARPLVAHEWVHVRDLVRSGLETDTMPSGVWLFRAGPRQYQTVPPHRKATQSRVYGRRSFHPPYDQIHLFRARAHWGDRVFGNRRVCVRSRHELMHCWSKNEFFSGRAQLFFVSNRHAPDRW